MAAVANPEPHAESRRLVLVVGIGRSGTSLFTGILAQLGFHVPQPEVEADETNPRGFGEPRWVVDFHTRLMRARHVTVFDSRPDAWALTAEAAADAEAVAELRSWLAVQLIGGDGVVVKDPRIIWFLPLWLRCAEQLGAQTSFATMLRQPAEVVNSARESYGEWQNDASRAAAWLNVTLHAELLTRGARRAFLRYADLLEDWPREITRAGELLNLPRLVGVDPADHPRIDEFVDPTLRRKTAGSDELSVPSPLQSLLAEAWEAISRLAEPDGDDVAARESLDVVRETYARLYADAEAIAQSSVTAVRPRPRRGAVGRAHSRRAKPSSGPRRVAAKLLPARRRKRLRRPAALSRLLERRHLAQLPVRLARHVPTRYRERVPVPIVRLGVALARAFRR